MRRKDFKHINDQALLELYYKNGDTFILGELLQRYTLLLYGVCMKYLKDDEAAKDSVQQVFLKAISELKKYKVQYLKSWLYMIARNHCLMQLRDKNISIEIETIEYKLIDEGNDRIKELHQTEIKYQQLEEAMNTLSADQRKCIELFYLKKQSYQSIAQITGYSLLQVKSYIQNGKRNLKNLILKMAKQPS